MTEPLKCEHCAERLWTLEANFRDYEHYHGEQHMALKEVLDAANGVLQERLARMNEFREEARTVQQTYVRQDIFDALKIAERLGSLEGRFVGIGLGLGMVALVSVAAAIYAAAK